MLSLGLLLELEGHTVTTAASGREAIRLMSALQPEVAIVDVGMPDIDGFEVARAIPADCTMDHITLVALTGYAADSDKSRALAAGIEYHLTKPLSLEELRTILGTRRRC
ncbi:response regulator [Paraburkholderia sp. MMS20-SJTN17]|uniref:Response regulator n=1 Tax=Paraburkholderia translucens TaxID=2886945 RepID=A0ABS8KM32_9BURK|nr:response regulator [Paraburkholderia sp. MMS20-SJTN17]MCC8405797.1 response regulator [Paraburkholderia sp. MMS20-SJTN17]